MNVRIQTKLISTFSLLLLFLFLIPANAQVTIGNSEIPVDGALLQLKNINETISGGANATQGLGFPKVKLISRTSLEPCLNSTEDADAGLRSQHTGLMVFNTEIDAATNLCPGLYVWDGDKWNIITEECFVLKLNKTTQNILNGNSIGLIANILPAAAVPTLTWQSSDPAVATVDVAGNVTSVAPGTANIIATVTHDGKTLTETCAITVGTFSMTVSGGDRVIIGDTAHLTATILPTWADVELEWTSTNPTEATVDASGIITGVGMSSWSTETNVQMIVKTKEPIGGTPYTVYHTATIVQPSIRFDALGIILAIDFADSKYKSQILDDIITVSPAWIDSSKLTLEWSVIDTGNYILHDPLTNTVTAVKSKDNREPGAVTVNCKVTYTEIGKTPIVTNKELYVSVHDLRPYQITDSRDGETYWTGFAGTYRPYAQYPGRPPLPQVNGSWWMLENLRTKMDKDGNAQPLGTTTWLYPSDNQVAGAPAYADDPTYYDSNNRVGLLYNTQFVHGATFPAYPDWVTSMYTPPMMPFPGYTDYTGYVNSICPKGFVLPQNYMHYEFQLDSMYSENEASSDKSLIVKTTDVTFQSTIRLGKSKKAQFGGVDIYPTGQNTIAEMNGARITLGNSLDGSGNFAKFHGAIYQWRKDDFGWGETNVERSTLIHTFDMSAEDVLAGNSNQDSQHNQFAPVRCMKHYPTPRNVVPYP